MTKPIPTTKSEYDDMPPIVVTFPLVGEWIAVNTPGDKVPSHGTDLLGQRFAYDFVAATDMQLSQKFSTGLRYWFGGGVPMKLTGGTGTPIVAPIDGRVIAAKDGWPERTRVTPLDILQALTFGLRLSEDDLRRDYRRVTGNYLIIEGKQAFAFLAHATTHSIAVSEGDEVVAGQFVARVGNTGNSTAPHLHFHLMDGPDLWTAKGMPCCFRTYKKLVDDGWLRIKNGIPKSSERIRAVANVAGRADLAHS